MKSDELKKHISATYTNLRIGMAGIALALPVLIAVYAYAAEGSPLKVSMSAYYYSAARDFFVGLLVAVGAFLFLYKGFSKPENIALNLAGGFVVGVAIFPTQPQPVSLHAACAVLFFLCIAYVCIFRAGDTLRLIGSDERRKWYRRFYKGLGWAMGFSPVAALFFTFIVQHQAQQRSTVFFIEAFAVWTFAFYWLAKSREIAETDAESLALQGKLQIEDPAKAA